MLKLFDFVLLLAVKVEKTEHAGTASGVEKCLKMAIGLKNTAIDYQIVAF